MRGSEAVKTEARREIERMLERARPFINEGVKVGGSRFLGAPNFPLSTSSLSLASCSASYHRGLAAQAEGLRGSLMQSDAATICRSGCGLNTTMGVRGVFNVSGSGAAPENSEMGTCAATSLFSGFPETPRERSGELSHSYR
jgi:hypothetical protein